MKVLITGCFGFIGYNFLEFLKKNYGNDIKIYGIDKLTNSYSEYNSKKNNQIQHFFVFDIYCCFI